MPLINSKIEEWTDEDEYSSAILLAYTGRSPVRDAFFRLYRSHWRSHLPITLLPVPLTTFNQSSSTGGSLFL